MVNFWFAGWEPIAHILVVGSLGYIALVLLMRISGKRTLAQMNSFDFVITVAIGATFAGVMLTRAVALAEAVTAFALITALQYAVSYMETHTKWFGSVVMSAPTVMAYGGRIIPSALRRERVTEDEVIAAVRKNGYGDLAQTAAVVMESNGQLVVLGPDRFGDGSALARLADAPTQHDRQ